MKKFLILALFVNGCLATESVKKSVEDPQKVNAEAAKNPSEAKGPSRYSHILDDDGSILLTVDSKENKVDLKKDPKETVTKLIQLLNRISQEAKREIAECQAAKARPSKPQSVK